MKDKVFGVLQRIGRSFMLPIAILPVAGLFLGIGGSFTNESMIEAYGLSKVLGEGTILNAFLTVLNACGSIVFNNLPILFAMGVAIGMAKKEKDVAALSIKKFNFKTPGREDGEGEVKLYTRKDVNERKAGDKVESGSNNAIDTVSACIVTGLGGASNISDIDCCATRLRCTVFDANLVNKERLNESGAAGVICKGQGVQVVFGPRVSVIKSSLEDFLDTEDAKKMTEEVFYSPVKGTVDSITKIKEPAFPKKMMGDCEIAFVFPTKHA